MEELHNDIALLKKEIESIKMSTNMLTTLIQSHQMLLNNLTNKSVFKPIVDKPVITKSVCIDHNELALEWLKKHTNLNGFNLEQFISECKGAISLLPLQDTEDKLEDVLTEVVRKVYEPISLKNKPFFCFGTRANRKMVYKNRSNEWVVETDEIVKQVYFLEKALRINQLGQINGDTDNMTYVEQEQYSEYSKWTTSEVSKSRIAKNLLEFITILEL